MKSPRNKTMDFTVEEGARYRDDLCYADAEGEPVPDGIRDRIVVGDAIRTMERLTPGIADLAIVDPPYNLTKSYHGAAFNRRGEKAYEDFTVAWIEALRPLLKKTASLYVCCDWESGMIIGPILKRYFKVRNRITWQREKGRGAKSNWKNGLEDIWYCTVSDDFTFHLDAVRIRRPVIAPYRENGRPKDWQEIDGVRWRDTCPSNFWDDITVPFWSMPENTAHPTQKPEKLIAKLILASSSPGDLVFDPFAGSGTTAVVAKKLERKFLVIEQNERYCMWGQARLERAETDREIQGYEDGIFYERNHKKQKG